MYAGHFRQTAITWEFIIELDENPLCKLVDLLIRIWEYNS